MQPVVFIGSSRSDLLALPIEVKREVGFVLHLAQAGDNYLHAKPLQGFGGAAVLEVVARHDGDTFRAIYTVKLSEAVFVLHRFKKKSKSGIATATKDLDLIRSRPRTAEAENARLRQHRLKEDADGKSSA
jgi:phage-related protein